MCKHHPMPSYMLVCRMSKKKSYPSLLRKEMFFSWIPCIIQVTSLDHFYGTRISRIIQKKKIHVKTYPLM